MHSKKRKSDTSNRHYNQSTEEGDSSSREHIIITGVLIIGN